MCCSVLYFFAFISFQYASVFEIHFFVISLSSYQTYLQVLDSRAHCSTFANSHVGWLLSQRDDDQHTSLGESHMMMMITLSFYVIYIFKSFSPFILLYYGFMHFVVNVKT
jgi:hypothetical protein